MGILEAIRSRFSAEVPDSEALTQELSGWLKKLEANEASTQAIKSGLAFEVISNGGKASTDKLEQLGRTRATIQAAVDALRIEIDKARMAEAAAALAARWAVSEQYGEEFIALAVRVNDVVDQLTDTCAELFTKYEKFFKSLPVQAGDFSPSRFVEDFPGFITSRVRCRSNDRLQLSRHLAHLAVVQLMEQQAHDVAARAEEQVRVALRALASAAPARSRRSQPAAESAQEAHQ
jgi:hypothetical protein